MALVSKSISVFRVLIFICLGLAACLPQKPPLTPPLQTLQTPAAAENLPQIGPAISASPAGENPAPATGSALPTQAAVQPVMETPENQAPDRPSVFLVCWDGGGAGQVYGMMEAGSLPHFEALAARGLSAEYALSTDPSLSAPAHHAISTGSYPARTGIVSNAYHNPNDSFYWYRSGFEQPLGAAEPVWVTASRAGLTTAAVFFAGASPAFPLQLADYTIGYGIRDAYSRQETIDLTPARAGWDGLALPSFSPALEGSFQIPEVARVYAYLLDSSDDRVSNYDTLLLNTARRVDAQTPRLQTGDWGPLLLRADLHAGADFLLQDITQGETASRVTLFYSGVHHNTAVPRRLLEGLNAQFGFFPAGPDLYALEHGWIGVEEFLHMLQRSARWMAEVTAWVYSTYRPDLLLAWQDGFDSAGHTLLMTDPRQSNYSAGRAGQYAEYYRRAAQLADQALQIMLRPVDLQTTTVMLVSDHGMAPVHTKVFANTILEKARLLALDSRNYVVEHRSKAFAVTSGGAVNIYINLKGRERAGIVNPDEFAGVQEQVIEAFASLSDPATGQPVFQRVLPRSALAELGLDHLHSGDVFAQANPGYEPDGWRGNEAVFEPSTGYGGHGYDSRLPEMHAFFIAAGYGVPSGGGQLPPVRLVDLAPTIAEILQFPPAPGVDGSPIPGLFD